MWNWRLSRENWGCKDYTRRRFNRVGDGSTGAAATRVHFDDYSDFWLSVLRDAMKGTGNAIAKWWGELPAYDTIDQAIGKWLGAGDDKPFPGTDIIVPGRQKAAHEAKARESLPFLAKGIAAAA